MNTGKLLGIDHGVQRIGLAVCDETRLIARELTIIHRTSKREDFEKINQLAKHQKVVGIIIGIPLDLDAEPGVHTQADTVRLWVERFQETTDLPIKLWDETMTSHEAAELSRQKKRRPQDPIDDLAARIILQSYLDAVRDGITEAL